MTPDEFTRRLPPIANDTVRFKPPFEFKNLSVRVFPLRASLDALQQVCNNYLNIVPPEIGSFRAVAPYAYLALLDYGEISEMEKSVGWFAQTEVYFGVPVEWYQVINGKWTFRDWAVITPFIFVDDDFSVPLGRGVFGFPKTLARVTKTSSDWLRDPGAPVTLARVKTMVFPELYKGNPLEFRVFLEVERDAPMSNVRLPFQAGSPIAPWVIASRVAEAMAGFGRDAMSIAQSMRIFNPNPWADPGFGGAMLNRLMPAFAPGGTGFALNSLNLKQFRSSSNPDNICYQALTNGRMQVVAFNGGGLLGEECASLGDLAGGYTITLHDYSSLPIARALGLEVNRRWRGDGVEMLAFKPVMPFWANLNVKYLAGTNLAWRTHDGNWRGGNGAPLDPSPSPDSPATDEPGKPEFNTAVTSAADDANVGPFEFKGAMIRVLPLLADCQTLQAFLDESINKAIDDDKSTKRHRVTVWSRPDSKYAYVYMTASSFGDVTSKANNIGDWAKYELSFLIPVKWEREGKGHKWDLEGVGLVPAFTFVDGTIAAISRTEVLGIPTLHAKFVRPSSVWLEEGKEDLDAKQTLLRVDAEVYTALHAGQSATTYPLIEISARDFAGIGEPDSKANPSEWAEVLRSELDSKKDTKQNSHRECRIARALALELLGNPSLTAGTLTNSRASGKGDDVIHTDDRVPFSLYTLKQIRDVADPLKACYQSLVRVPRIFDEVFDLREIDETLRVRIHEFPSLRLVEQLGIVAKTVREEGAGIVYGTQAIRPFYIRAAIHEQHGERLLWRAGTRQWTSGKADSFLSDSRQHVKVDMQAECVQGQGDPCQMKSVMRQSIERRRRTEPKPSEHDFVRSVIKSSSAVALDDALKAAEKAAAETAPETAAAGKVVTKKAVTKKALAEAVTTEQAAPRDTEIVADLREAFEKETQKHVGLGLTEGDKSPAPLAADEFARVVRVICARIQGFQEHVRDWHREQEIAKRDASDALKVIDPQMVIESVLSREWGSLDEKALWRKGLRALREARDTMLGVGSVPFAKFNLPDQLNKQGLETALDEARKNFAAIERALYLSVRLGQATRPGWLLRMNPANQIIDQMERFTRLRLEMNDCFSVLAAWSIAPTLLDSQSKDSESKDPQSRDYQGREAQPTPTWVEDIGMKADAQNATRELLAVMTQICFTPVIGTPSKDEDPQVRADLTRLRELLDVLKLKVEVGSNLDAEIDQGRMRKIEEFLGGQPSDQVWLIDVVREAVQFAGRYCDVQREALFNKLSRASQKPDFCVRRDSVDQATRDKYFPRSESWDEDWYSGPTPADDRD